MNETTMPWRRSSRCEANTCVEVATMPGGVLVRDGADPAGPVLAFDGDAWRAFLAGIRGGELAR